MATENALIRLRLLGAAQFRGDTRRAERGLRDVGTAARRSSGQLGGIARSPAAGGLARIRTQAQQATTALRGVHSAGRSVSGMRISSPQMPAAGAAGGGVGTMAAAGAGAAAASKRGAVAVALVTGAVGKLGVEYNAMQDSQRVAFTTFLGSQRKALMFMRQLQALAVKSPVLDPATTGESARMLMGYGMSARKTLPFIEALGDMSAASGRSIAEVMPQAARALGQIGSKGSLQTEELNQLAESVGLNRNLIAKELGLTRKEFAATFTAGNNLKSAAALPAVLAAMKVQSGGAGELLAKTTAGRVARASEMMKVAAGQLTRPLYQAFGDVAGRAAGLLERLTEGGQIKRVGQMIASGLRGGIAVIGKVAKGVVGVVGQVLDALKPAAPFFQNVLLPLLKGVAEGVIASLVGAFKIAVPIIKGVATALGFVGRLLSPLKGAFEVVGNVVGVVFGPAGIGQAAKALGFFGGKFKIVIKIVSSIGKALAGVARGFAKAVTWAGRFASGFTGGIRTAVLFVTNRLQGVIGFVGKVVDKITGLFGKVPGVIKAAFTGIGGFLGNVFGGVRTTIIDILNWIIDKLNFVIRKVNSVSVNTPFGRIGANIGEIGLIEDAPSPPSLADQLTATVQGVSRSYGDPVPITRRGARNVMGAASSRRFSDAGPTHLSDNIHVTVQTDGRTTHRAVARVERQLERQG